MRIVLAAEQALFRDGLRSLLEAEWRPCIVEELADDLALAFPDRPLQPKLLVLDLASGRFPALDLLEKIAARIPVVVLWDERDRPDHEALRRSGVWRLIDKRLGAIALLEAIRPVLMRASDRADADAQVSDRPKVVNAAPNPDFHLTQRERQIVGAVASGFPNREIAQQLRITQFTVKRHLTSIFDKLGVSNRVELTLFAVHHGLLDGSAPPQGPGVLSRPSNPPHRVLPWPTPAISTR